MPRVDPPAGALHALVVQKLTKVFGEQKGAVLLESVLAETELARVETTADLERVAEALQKRGGFEATTGAMLGVLALMHGVRAR